MISLCFAAFLEISNGRLCYTRCDCRNSLQLKSSVSSDARLYLDSIVVKTSNDYRLLLLSQKVIEMRDCSGIVHAYKSAQDIRSRKE